MKTDGEHEDEKAVTQLNGQVFTGFMQGFLYHREAIVITSRSQCRLLRLAVGMAFKGAFIMDGGGWVCEYAASTSLKVAY